MEYPDKTVRKQVDKSFILASLEGSILISYIVTICYLKCKKRIETDFKSKMVIGIYICGMMFGFIVWIFDILIEEDSPTGRKNYVPIFVYLEMIDSFGDYIITLSLYLFIYEMFETKILLESESRLLNLLRKNKLQLYSLIFVSVALITMISGVLLVHLEMYYAFFHSKCINVRRFIDPFAVKVAIGIYAVRTVQDLCMLLLFMHLFIYFMRAKLSLKSFTPF
jgi:hypothetical protein